MSELQVRLPVVIDFAKNTYVEVEVTKRSANGYIMEFYLLNQGKKIAKEDIGVITLKATTESGKIVFNDILVSEGECVEYEVSKTILAEEGRTTCVLQLMDVEGNTIHSFEWYVNVKSSLYDENAYVKQDDITAVRSYVLRAEDAANKSEEHEKYLKDAHETFGNLGEELKDAKEDMEDFLREVEDKVKSGAFTGASGIQGPEGKPGRDGIVASVSGFYTLVVEDGKLYVYYDGDEAPNFELTEDGELYYIISKEKKTLIGEIANNAVLQSEKGVAGGVASLDETGKVPKEQLPEVESYSSEGKDSFATNDSAVASGEGAFASGVDNLAIGDGSVVFGANNIAGSRAYYISALDFGNRKIYLSNTQVSDAPPTTTGEVDTSFETPTYEVGDQFNIIVPDNHYILCGTIESIENNVVTYTEDSNLGFTKFMSLEELQDIFGTTEWSEICSSDDYTFAVPSQPLVGIVVIAGNGFVTGAYNIGAGAFAHVEGACNLASGNFGHAEGQNTIAGYSAHAEGYYNQALGKNSHAEGAHNITSGDSSHAEGTDNTVVSMRAHAEGFGNVASGHACHVEGRRNTITVDGENSHAEGFNNTISASTAHAEGEGTKAIGYVSHTEGYYTEASRKYSHAEGEHTIASHVASHAEGYYTTASGYYSHAEGNNTKATAHAAHAEGYYTEANKSNSHAEGEHTIASHVASHAEGYYTKASGYCAHVEGYYTKASGYISHAEGDRTEASGYYSHAEGEGTKAIGYVSHAEGYDTKASGYYSHAEGESTTASGYASHAEGESTTAYGSYSHVQGKWNTEDKEHIYAHIVGGGTSTTHSNLHTIRWSDGQGFFKGGTTAEGADYAEFFEWLDGNLNNEDRVGLLVTLEGEKIKLANNGDEIIGIISGTAAVLGDNYECEWNGKYLTDDFGRVIYDLVEEFVDIEHIEFKEVEKEVIDEDTNKTRIEIELEEVKTVEKKSTGLWKHPRLNPDYDPSQEYINRADRPEWDTVGMLGKLYVRDDGTCKVNGYATVGENGVATASSEKTNMRVLSRVNENVVRVLLK